MSNGTQMGSGQLGSGGRTFVQRMIAAAMLDTSLYNEVEPDTSATGQAAGVVAIVAVALAIGSIGSPGGNVIAAVISAVVGWLIWAGVTYIIGGKFLGGTATWGELLRTLGFAQSPGVLYVISGIFLIGPLVHAVVAVWILLAGIVAIREALDFSTGKAVLTAVIGWLFLAVTTMLFAIPGALGS
jgi:hypothetical protein